MIIKGRSRGRARQLAAHLLSADQNEVVRLFECRGTVADDVAGALAEIEAHAEAVVSKRPLYHASISPAPDMPLTDRQIRVAVDHLEKKLGFDGQPRVVVQHLKSGREHVHVVWSRVDAEKGRSIPDAWNFRKHEEVARELEAMFGHKPVKSSHVRRGIPADRTVNDYELRQAERSGVSPRRITNDITSIWQTAKDGAEFRRRLEEAGYRLARGDRRVFVVIDHAGEVHSLARRVEGADTSELRERLADLDLSSLPSVAAARKEVRHHAKRSALRARFTRVARQVTSRSYRPSPAIPRFERTAQSSVPNVAVFASGSTAISGATIQYRSMRAILVASFAARLADAIRNAPEEERAAMIEALRQERIAALQALAREQEVTKPVPKLRHQRRERRPIRVRWGRAALLYTTRRH